MIQLPCRCRLFHSASHSSSRTAYSSRNSPSSDSNRSRAALLCWRSSRSVILCSRFRYASRSNWSKETDINFPGLIQTSLSVTCNDYRASVIRSVCGRPVDDGFGFCRISCGVPSTGTTKTVDWRFEPVRQPLADFERIQPTSTRRQPLKARHSHLRIEPKLDLQSRHTS
jgi:hypothetical protein